MFHRLKAAESGNGWNQRGRQPKMELARDEEGTFQNFLIIFILRREDAAASHGSLFTSPA